MYQKLYTNYSIRNPSETQFDKNQTHYYEKVFKSVFVSPNNLNNMAI